MMAYYSTKGLSLQDRLNQILDTYGYYTESVLSFTYEGAAGKQKMADIMKSFRSMTKGDAFAGYTIVEKTDLLHGGPDGLPPSDVIILKFSTGDKMVIRPSGTEPKIKYYLFFHAAASQRETFQAQLQERIARFKSEL